MITTIEYLPNELFLEIFQYIDAWQLCHTWSKLNQRLQNLVCSIAMYAHCQEFDDYDTYQSLFIEHAKQLISIRMNKKCGIWKELDLSTFSNIRSLHLGIINGEQYDQILPENLPLLTNLTIDQVDTSRNPAMLLFGSKPFAYLNSCHLPYFLSTDMSLQSCLTVRSLRLQFCSAEIFFLQIKIFLPNLISFETISGTDITFINSIEIQRTLLLLPHRNLRSIRIELGKETTFDYLPLICTVLPELRLLKLYCRTYCDYPQVAELLQTKLVKLKSFNFIVNESRFQRLPDLQILMKMSPWFAQVQIEQFNDFRRIVCERKIIKD